MNRHILRSLPLLLAAGVIAQPTGTATSKPAKPTTSVAKATPVPAPTPVDSSLLKAAREATELARSATAEAKAARDAANAANESAKAARDSADAANERVKVLERLRELDAEDAAARAKSTPTVQANASGLLFRSSDSAWSIRLRGVLRSSAIWDLNDESKKTLDQFQNNTVRLGFEGALAKRIEYRIQADFSKGAVGLQDAYTDIRFAKWAVVRVGKFQVPLGWERYQAPGDLLFLDRALPSSIAPNRDVGVQVSGDLLKGKLQYALAGVNGGADASNINGDVNDDKDGYARLWVVPAKGSENAWISGLGLGVAGSYGYHDISLPSYKSAFGTTYFSWLAADSASGEGWRIAPQASWTAGPFWIWGEWIRSQEAVRKGATYSAASATVDSIGTGAANKGTVYWKGKAGKATDPVDPKDIATTSWQAGFSWVVTGEDASEKGVKPRHPFDGSENGGLGALELAARISGLSIGDEAFPIYADTAKSSSAALSWAVSANWHLVKGTRIQIAYERTIFDGGNTQFDHVDIDAKGKKTDVYVVRDRKPENILSVTAATAF